MGKQIFKKTVGALLAVLFLISLTASAVAACEASGSSAADPLSTAADPLSSLGIGNPLSSCGTGCNNGACGTGCDSCGTGCDSCGTGCDSCGTACDSCGTACDACSACDTCSACNTCSACDDCHHGCCCKKPEPTWQDWFNAFKNDGFELWAGFNFANFWGNFI